MPPRLTDTSMKIIQILKTISQGKYYTKSNPDEMAEFDNNAFCYETLVKYFATLSFADIKYFEYNNKIFLQNAIEKFDLSEEDVKIFYEFIDKFKEIASKNNYVDFREMMYVFKSFLSDENLEVWNSYNIDRIFDKKFLMELNEEISFYEKICSERLKIQFNFKNKSYTDLEPINLNIRRNKIFLVCYNTKKSEEKKFNIKYIENLKQLCLKTTGMVFPSSVTFRVYKELKNNYTLRECEKVLDYGEDFSTIINFGTEKQELFNRLIKYGENCEVIAPVSVRNEFKDFIKNIYQSIEV